MISGMNEKCGRGRRFNVILYTQIGTTVLMDLRPEYYIYNYLILHPTHVVDVRKGIRSKNVAPILFINTPGKGVL